MNNFKRIIGFLFIIVIIAINVNAQNQLKRWYISGSEINMTSSPIAITKSIGGSTTGVNGPQNGIYDEKGDVQFYINGGVIYNRNNVLEGSIPTYTKNIGYEKSDISIVPFMDNNACRSKYYVFYSNAFELNNTLNVGLYGKSVEVDRITGSLTIQNLNNNNPFSTFSDPTGSLLNQGVYALTSMAVSNVKNGVRYLYWIAGYNSNLVTTLTNYAGKVAKITISAPTVTNTMGIGTSTNLSIPSSVKCYASADLELNDDGTKLAWGCSRVQTGNKGEFYILNLNTTGDYVSFSTFSSTVAGTSVGMRGVEFSANGNSLYFTTGDNTNLNGGVFVYNFSSNLQTIIPASRLYAISQIEKGANGLIYIANVNSIASINPSTNVISGTALSISPPKYPGGYLLPDQIDGCNYDLEMHPLVVYDQNTFNASGVSTWTNSSNPINTSGNPIRIKNVLRFTGGAGTNITISGMTFEFGENAKLILDPGVKLNLYNTTLKSINCNVMWDGIEVSDNAVLTSNSTVNQNKVGSFILDAHVGISTNSNKTVSHSSIKLDIKNTEFDRNHQHIFLINSRDALISITNNRFLHSLPLKDQTGLWGFKDPSSFLYFGKNSIDVWNYLAFYPPTKTNITNNIFFKGYRGINSYRASFIAQNNSFQNMNITKGIGIYVNMVNAATKNSSNFVLKANIIASGNQFSNVHSAFYEYFGETNLVFNQNNVYNTNTSAVYFGNNKNYSIIIRENNFRNCKDNAIQLVDNAGAQNGNQTEIDINKNSIESQLQSTGISISESAKTSQASYFKLNVSDNTMSNIAFGIKMYNVVGYQDNRAQPNGGGTSDLNGNTIGFYATKTRLKSDYNMGISLVNCKGLRVLANNISTTVNNTWRNCGIECNNTTNTLVRENIVKAGRGVSGIENGLGNNFVCNIFNQNVNGISLGDYKFRIPKEVHGVLGVESRDNTFNSSIDKDIELYLWHIDPTLPNNLRMNIDNNQWVILPKDPSLIIYPDPNVMFKASLSKPHIDYIKANIGKERTVCDNGEASFVPTSIISPNSENNFDPFYLWQLQYDYEKYLKTQGQSKNTFLSNLIDIEDLVLNNSYSQAISLLPNLQVQNNFEKNIREFYQLYLDVLLNDNRSLTSTEINDMSIIANGNTFSTGPAVLESRNFLWNKEGLEFSNDLDRTLPIVFNINYSGCYDYLPNNIEVLLVDNNGSTYPNIPISIENNGRVHLSGFEIDKLNPSLTYSFLINYPHSPIGFYTIEDWQNLPLVITEFCQAIGKSTNVETKSNLKEELMYSYPNPLNDKLYLSINDESVKNVEIVDMYGRVIFSMEVKDSKNNIEINCKEWSSGTYFVRIYNANKALKTQKIIKM